MNKRDTDEEMEDVPVIIDGKAYPDIRRNLLDEIALTSFALGVMFGVSLISLFFSPFKSFNLYMVSLSVFHMLEFWTTARFNPGKLTTNSFLINNGSGYFLAHLFAICETMVEYFLFPSVKSISYSKFHATTFVIGTLLLILGQYVRSSAMVTAGQSFSHIVKVTRNSDHKLITTGIYSRLRHPSYFGFFWWAIGTQLILLNPVSLILFTVVLWKFFNSRIKYEERFLIQFFGNQYLSYKKTVGVHIPFIE